MPTHILYLTYDGLLDPLGQSQILPYLRALQRNGFQFSIISFEKAARWGGVAKLLQQLSREGISWYPLRYHKWPSAPATLFDVLQGIRVARRLIAQHPIHIIHARSYVASLIALGVKTPKQKFVFDMRGFWPEERVEGGLWSRHAPLFHLAKWFEQKFFAAADHVVVLTHAAARILRTSYRIRKPISVIPTCVDTALFSPRQKDPQLLRQLGLGNTFVLTYSGSLGTWYCFREMRAFFSALAQRISAHFLLLVNDLAEAQRMLAKYPLPYKSYTLRTVCRSDLPRWLSLSDATLSFIMPAFSKRGSAPTKVAESLAMGIPVVANASVGDTCALLKRTRAGVYLPSLSRTAIASAASALVRLRRDASLRSRCRSAAVDSASLIIGVQQYAAIYRRLRR